MISGTREWAVAEINCNIGCPHDCRYCYARVAALKKGLIDSGSDWSRTRIIEAEVESSRPLYGGQVMFPTAHDIVEDNLDEALQVVSRLLEAGNKVLIVSKPSRCCIKEICDRFSRQRSQILFRFTITSRNSDILSFWEPGAPAYQERLESLQQAFKSGFQTSVSIEPMLDLEDVQGMIGEIEPYVSHSIWIGKLNRIEERVQIVTPEVAAEVERIRHQQQDRNIIDLYEALNERPLVRWKESIKLVVGLPLATESGLDI
ncbi:MAG: hypothetical protein HKP44_12250 [Desulfofustis sp.]|nr:hypothetical protein [Desulfofustis sp.]